MGKTKPYRPRIHRPEEVIEVPHSDDMDDETLIKHIEHRHAQDYRVEGTSVSRNAMEAWIAVWRAYHDRLHKIATPGQYDHEHEEEW